MQYFRAQVLAVPVLLADLGHVVRRLCIDGQPPGNVQSFPGQCVGAVCPRLSGQLHSEPGGVYDHY